MLFYVNSVRLLSAAALPSVLLLLGPRAVFGEDTCPSGDSGNCDFAPTNPYVCGPDYSCSYSSICEVEAAEWDLEVDCCQAPQTSACGMIFQPLICGDKECPYSNLCLAELAGYEESQCETPPEECPVSSDDCSGAPSNPFTCGPLRCYYPTLCELGDAGFDYNECCQGPRNNNDCDMSIQPVSCGPPGGKQCVYDNQCLADDSGYNENQCCGLVPDDVACVAMYAPVECGPVPCVYTNQCEATAAGYSESDCCPQQAEGACSMVYDPVTCGEGECTYTSQSCAELAGFSSDQCSRVNGPDCDSLTSCSDCLDESCAWSPVAGDNGACFDSCADGPQDAPCYSDTCPDVPLVWEQSMPTLASSTTGDYFGSSNNFDASGTRFVVSASKSSESGLNGAGMVRVYDIESDGRFNQVGQTLYGSKSGYEIQGVLSGSGTRLALYSQKRNDSTGRVWMYELRSGQWVEFGKMSGTNAGERFGQTVALNKMGNVVAVGVSFANNKEGLVRAYKYMGATSWVQIGDDIEGEFQDGKFGWDIALATDTDDLIMAIGQKSDDSGNNSGRAGQVRVFRWNGSNQSWSQVGSTIFGQRPGDSFGRQVSIDAAGTTFAAGARYYDSPNGADSGGITAFSNTDGSQWSQVPFRGAYIDGDGSNDQIVNNAMNAAGDRIAAGAGGANGGVGYVRVYDMKANGWKAGNKLSGQSSGEGFGSNIDLSQDGTRLLVGSPSRDNKNIRASVRIYELVPAGTYNYPHISLEAQSASDNAGDTSPAFFKHTASIVAALVAAAVPVLYV